LRCVRHHVCTRTRIFVAATTPRGRLSSSLTFARRAERNNLPGTYAFRSISSYFVTTRFPTRTNTHARFARTHGACRYAALRTTPVRRHCARWTTSQTPSRNACGFRYRCTTFPARGVSSPAQTLRCRLFTAGIITRVACFERTPRAPYRFAPGDGTSLPSFSRTHFLPAPAPGHILPFTPRVASMYRTGAAFGVELFHSARFTHVLRTTCLRWA